MSENDQTAVDKASAAARKNVESLSNKRILALYALVSFVWLGTELGNIDVPFSLGLLAFAFLALAGAHTYQRERTSGTDVVVGGYVVATFLLAGAELNVLDIPLGPRWMALILLGLLAADGYLINH